MRGLRRELTRIHCMMLVQVGRGERVLVRRRGARVHRRDQVMGVRVVVGVVAGRDGGLKRM